ncbi:MAG: hypothetical protein ACE5KI_04225, partial [Dehalococcoidia bacterium]
RGEALEGRCGRCDFREVCGGCRARAFALTGNLSAEDPWCAYQPAEQATSIQDGLLFWSAEARERLQRIPPFVRQRVKVAVERHAQAIGKGEITPAELTATLEGLGRSIPFRRPQNVAHTGTPPGNDVAEG